MRTIAKAGLIGAGYVAALAIASAVVAAYLAATNGPGRQSSSGMYAFGDALLFVGVFAVAAIPATCAALFFLRQCSSFWLVLSVVASAVAITGLAALLAQTPNAHSALHPWSGLAILRIFAAPVFGLAFLLSGIFAPRRSFRIVLLVATASEAVVFFCVIFSWIR